MYVSAMEENIVENEIVLKGEVDVSLVLHSAKHDNLETLIEDTGGEDEPSDYLLQIYFSLPEKERQFAYIT